MGVQGFCASGSDWTQADVVVVGEEEFRFVERHPAHSLKPILTDQEIGEHLAFTLS